MNKADQAHVERLVAAAKLQGQMELFEGVLAFNQLGGQEVNWPAQWPDDEVLNQKISLIESEWNEVLEAVEKKDLLNLAKELADLVYVVDGFAGSCGINRVACSYEVQNSNMSKFAKDPEELEDSAKSYNEKYGKDYCQIAFKDGYYFVKKNKTCDEGPAGKVLKPWGYKEADMSRVVTLKKD